MIRLWRHLIKPVLLAADARTVLEIGAEFGTSTKVLLNYVREVGGHLHCVDPAPEFDAQALQRENAGHVSFHRDLSLNVISELPPFDAAMVDGDHNWYTVFNELQLIEAVHGHDALQQPVVFVHDIGWPYGRRDLYYDPATIPEEYRHPYKRKGMLPNKAELQASGGMNLELCNAVGEGGPRNGVLTAVEDYLAGSALDFRFLNLPLYYGLGILVTEQRLTENTQLAAEIGRLEELLRGEDLIRLAEHLRLVEGVVLQTLNRQLQASRARVEELEEALATVSGDRREARIATEEDM